MCIIILLSISFYDFLWSMIIISSMGCVGVLLHLRGKKNEKKKAKVISFDLDEHEIKIGNN